LTGELRYVAHGDRRLEEAARFGLERVVLPASCAEDGEALRHGATALAAPTVQEALTMALRGDSRLKTRAA